MPDLPARADFDQLRHQAKDLLEAARNGDEAAIARIARVSSRMGLAAAQLAVARDYGFASWARLKVEVDRRAILDARDVDRLATVLAESPGLAVERGSIGGSMAKSRIGMTIRSERHPCTMWRCSASTPWT